MERYWFGTINPRGGPLALDVALIEAKLTP